MQLSYGKYMVEAMLGQKGGTFQPEIILSLLAEADVGIGALDTVLAAEANGRTRVVLNLDDLVSYETRVAGNTVYVTLETPATSQANGATRDLLLNMSQARAHSASSSTCNWAEISRWEILPP